MRIGIFGGSFDPIHQGHLILAENCREQASLDLVLFIPCATSPHKADGASSTDRQRCEMVELAIAGHEEPQRICELAVPLVANRPGSGEIDLSVLKKHASAERYQQACDATVDSPMIEISSSVIQSRIVANQSIRYLLPRGVERYIESQSVYAAKAVK